MGDPCCPAETVWGMRSDTNWCLELRRSSERCSLPCSLTFSPSIPRLSRLAHNLAGPESSNSGQPRSLVGLSRVPGCSERVGGTMRTYLSMTVPELRVHPGRHLSLGKNLSDLLSCPAGRSLPKGCPMATRGTEVGGDMTFQGERRAGSRHGACLVSEETQLG